MNYVCIFIYTCIYRLTMFNFGFQLEVIEEKITKRLKMVRVAGGGSFGKHPSGQLGQGSTL